MNSKWAAVLLTGVFAVAAMPEKTKPVEVKFYSRFIEGTQTGKQLTVDQTFSAAVKEATERNAPLVFIFGKDHCGGCEALEGGTLSNKKFAEFAAENFIMLKSHSGHDHGTTKIPDPYNKGKEIEVCAKFPNMNCDQHEKIGGFMSSFAKEINFSVVPQTYVVSPVTKKVIEHFEGDWSAKALMEKKMDKIEEAMPGGRVGAADYAKYRKAQELAKDGKTKEAQDIFSALRASKKLPEAFKANLDKEISALSPSSGK